MLDCIVEDAFLEESMTTSLIFPLKQEINVLFMLEKRSQDSQKSSRT